MSRKMLITAGLTMITTIIFVIAYLVFNVFEMMFVDPKIHEITIVTDSGEKIYDGEALTVDEWMIASGSLLDGHVIDQVLMPSSITNAGTVENVIYITIKDKDDNDVTDRYRIRYEYGDLTIYQREIIVITDDVLKTYDGETLTSDHWEIISGTLVSEHTVDAQMFSEIRYPGQISNDIVLNIADQDGIDVTKNYQVIYELGQLTVLPKPLSVVTGSAEKDYDGEPLTNTSWSIQSGSVLINDRLEFIMNDSITNPGSISNNIGITIFNEENEDVTACYDITYQLGDLTVHPIPLIIKSESQTKVYDGEPLTIDQWELLDGELLEGHRLIVDVDGSITDIGEIENRIYAYVLNQYDQNVSSFYQMEYVPGLLVVLGSVYGSGNISKESVTPSNEAVLNVFSQETATLYLRDLSYGSYNMQGWDAGQYHELSLSTSPLNYTAHALDDNNNPTLELKIQYLRDYMSYLTPYYSEAYSLDQNDVHIFGDVHSTAIHNYYPYDFDANQRLSISDVTFSAEELSYRNYVYQEFLKIPESTRRAMLMLASENGIDASSLSVIEDVQTYIQNAATYNLDFAPIPDDVSDIAIYFLTVSKEGICQHYATAGTLMYRALGIPARYVTGYLAKTDENKWTLISGEFAHAWVEIYIDGFGWIPIEVTGGGPGGGSGSGSGEGELAKSIEVKPRTVREPYVEGLVIQATEIMVEGFLQFALQGYTYEYTLMGDLSHPGITYSEVSSFKIYDAEHQDVTREFTIKYTKGILQLYTYQLEIQTGSASKVYDGTPIMNHTYVLNSTLASGHVIENAIFTSERINVGASLNKVTLKIVNLEGEDVTSLYRFIGQYGNLIITPRTIKIASSSAIKTYDGTVLTDSTFSFLEGELAEGDILEVNITGYQLSIGRSSNTISYIKILRNGLDMTSNYLIEFVEGELVVLPDE